MKTINPVTNLIAAIMQAFAEMSHCAQHYTRIASGEQYDWRNNEANPWQRST